MCIRSHSSFSYISVHHLCSFTAWRNVSSYSKRINDVITITPLGKLSWYYVSSTFPSFSQKHTTHQSCWCAIPFLLNLLLWRTIWNRKKRKPIESSLLKLIVHQSDTAKYQLFTWNANNRFSKEHKTLIVSQKCMCCLNCVHSTWYFRGWKISHFSTCSIMQCWKH